MPSFDVVSNVELMEVDNAVNTANKEIGQRYDFRGTNTAFERGPEGITLRTSDKEHAEAAMTVLRGRFAKRNISQRSLDMQKIEPAAGQSVKQLVKLKQGIDKDTGKKITKKIRDQKLKVQAQIQGEEVEGHWKKPG